MRQSNESSNYFFVGLRKTTPKADNKQILGDKDRLHATITTILLVASTLLIDQHQRLSKISTTVSLISLFCNNKKLQ